MNTLPNASLSARWHRPADGAELVWHCFADDDWVVYEPGTGSTHALGWLAATVLTLVEDGANSAESLGQALGNAATGAVGFPGAEHLSQDAILLALTQLHASGLIECM